MGQTAQPWVGRISRIDRAEFWRTIKETLSLRGWAGREANGAYYGGARQRWRSCAHLSVQSMTPIQFETLRQLHAVRRAAQNSYHACLASKVPDSERHAAELACSAAVKAIAQYSKGL